MRGNFRNTSPWVVFSRERLELGCLSIFSQCPTSYVNQEKRTVVCRCTHMYYYCQHIRMPRRWHHLAYLLGEVYVSRGRLASWAAIAQHGNKSSLALPNLTIGTNGATHRRMQSGGIRAETTTRRREWCMSNVKWNSREHNRNVANGFS